MSTYMYMYMQVCIKSACMWIESHFNIKLHTRQCGIPLDTGLNGLKAGSAIDYSLNCPPNQGGCTFGI